MTGETVDIENHRGSALRTCSLVVATALGTALLLRRFHFRKWNSRSSCLLSP